MANEYVRQMLANYKCHLRHLDYSTDILRIDHENILRISIWNLDQNATGLEDRRTGLEDRPGGQENIIGTQHDLNKQTFDLKSDAVPCVEIN